MYPIRSHALHRVTNFATAPWREPFGALASIQFFGDTMLVERLDHPVERMLTLISPHFLLDLEVLPNLLQREAPRSR